MNTQSNQSTVNQPATNTRPVVGTSVQVKFTKLQTIQAHSEQRRLAALAARDQAAADIEFEPDDIERAFRLDVYDSRQRQYERRDRTGEVVGLMAEMGSQEAFHPGSQVPPCYRGALEKLVGRTMTVEVTQCEPGRNVVVSLWQHQAKLYGQLLNQVKHGQDVDALVTHVWEDGSYEVELDGGAINFVRATDCRQDNIILKTPKVGDVVPVRVYHQQDRKYWSYFIVDARPAAVASFLEGKKAGQILVGTVTYIGPSTVIFDLGSVLVSLPKSNVTDDPDHLGLKVGDRLFLAITTLRFNPSKWEPNVNNIGISATEAVLRMYNIKQPAPGMVVDVNKKDNSRLVEIRVHGICVKAHLPNKPGLMPNHSKANIGNVVGVAPTGDTEHFWSFRNPPPGYKETMPVVRQTMAPPVVFKLPEPKTS